MARKLETSIPRITLTPPEAAASLGCGPDFFNEHVAPELKVIRRGRKRLIPIVELERWAAENAESILGDFGDSQHARSSKRERQLARA